MAAAGFWAGPICDNLGLRQHSGECWSDSLQELFMFADTFKETVQPTLYNEALPMTSDDALATYLTFMKLRFINHYNYLITRDPAMLKCINPTILRRNANTNTTLNGRKLLKRQISESASIKSARVYVAKNSGGTSEIVTDLANKLLKAFGLTHTMKAFGQFDDIEYNPSTIGIYIFCKTFNRARRIRPGSHAISTFMCDGNFYFYDDNFGSFKLNISMERFCNEVGGVAYSKIGDTITPILLDKAIGIDVVDETQMSPAASAWDDESKDFELSQDVFKKYPESSLIYYIVFTVKLRFDKKVSGGKHTRRRRGKQHKTRRLRKLK
jgi:hypothetical protein